MKACFHIKYFLPWRFIVREVGGATRRDTYTWATSHKHHPSSQLWLLELFAIRQNRMFQNIRCVSGKKEDVQTAEISNTVEAFGHLLTSFRGIMHQQKRSHETLSNISVD